MNDTDFYIKILELEIAALRSVLSESEEPLDAYTQWHRAEALAELKSHIARLS